MESCRVHEESLEIVGRVKAPAEKSSLIERALVDSEIEAIGKDQSLAIIRPTEVSLTWKALSESELREDQEKFAAQAAQLSLLEEEIASYSPCPYKFTMRYRDGGGLHNKTCADWETSAAFFNLRRSMEETAVLKHLECTYCEDYVASGLVLALGNMKKRPKTWQLLGIFPVKPLAQADLFGH